MKKISKIKNSNKVKKNNPMLLLFLLSAIIAGTGGCKEDVDNENIPYVACFHEGVYIDTADIKGDAYLFNDSIPVAIKTALSKESYQAWIIYDKETDSAVLYVESPRIISTNHICNYPLFAKQWNIPEGGEKYTMKALHIRWADTLVSLLLMGMI
jgi:hypothetical protein